MIVQLFSNCSVVIGMTSDHKLYFVHLCCCTNLFILLNC